MSVPPMNPQFYGVFQLCRRQLCFQPFLVHVFPLASVSFAPPDYERIFAEEYDETLKGALDAFERAPAVLAMQLCNTSARLALFANLRQLVLLNCSICQETFEQISGLGSLRQLQCIECPLLADFGFLARLKLRCFILVTEQMKINLPQGKFSIMLVIVRGSVYRKSCDCLLSDELEKRLRNIKLINNNVQLGAASRPAVRQQTAGGHDMLRAPVAPQKGTSLKSRLQMIGKDNILVTDLTSSSVFVQQQTYVIKPLALDYKEQAVREAHEGAKDADAVQQKQSEHAKVNKLVKPERKAFYRANFTLSKAKLVIDLYNGARQQDATLTEKTAAPSVRQLPKKPKKPARLHLQCEAPLFEPPRCKQYAETQDTHFVFKKPTKPASRRVQPADFLLAGK